MNSVLMCTSSVLYIYLLINFIGKQQSMSKRDRNRQEAIWELLQTERAYIRSLQTILDVSSFWIE